MQILFLIYSIQVTYFKFLEMWECGSFYMNNDFTFICSTIVQSES